MKNLLTIAGSDCSGGAGIQADIKTFSAHGCYGMSVITAVTAQNTCRVISVENVATSMIANQMDAIFEDIEVHAVKVGMLSDATIMQAVANKLVQYAPPLTVIDPVMIAKGGHALMQADALDTLRRKIISRAYLLTPNIPEAAVIVGQAVENIDDMKSAAQEVYKLGAKNVLIKGGHLIGDAVDVLFNGKSFQTFTHQRIDSHNTHGTGCTLSSAIAANLANGLALAEAVGAAKQYVTEAIACAPNIGEGHGPLNHFYSSPEVRRYNQERGLRETCFVGKEL
ncbi:MAG: bifunctional hydroxymethylpyrimidine kinase/phosphomethylpyrimidine kinase [Oscillospiraceae bacterium]|nr:bifunctional hydroxymethylpyrimidine kinase/phosphomethylpyrimidine kinase [Oscillospiraceae bacterium]